MSIIDKLAQVGQAAENERDHMRDVLDNSIPKFAKEHAETICPSDLRISTITIVCKTSLGAINVHALRDHLEQYPDSIEEGVSMSNKTLGNGSVIFKWKQGQRNVSAQVFTTGSFQIAGVRDPAEAILITHFFCKRLDSLAEESDDSTCSCVLSYEICMINSTFAIPFNVNLVEAEDAWRKSTMFSGLGSCKFEREKHPGLQIKLENVFVFIFASGKVIVTGARHIDNLFHGYKTACGFLSEFVNRICFKASPKAKIPGKRGRKKKQVVEAFYDGFKL